MRKLFLTAAIIAAMLFVSGCQKENRIENIADEAPMTFTAVITDGPATKTNLDGMKVEWEAGDEISINGITFTATPDVTDNSIAVFTKKDSTSANPVAPFTAYYPASIYNGSSTVLPATQSYGDFSLNPMYASGNTQRLDFKNICAVIAVKVKNNDVNNVRSIKLYSKNKATSGTFTVSGQSAVLSDSTSVTDIVTLDCGDTGVTTTASGTVFHIAIPAQIYRNLTIEVSDGTTSKAMTTVRNSDISTVANTIYPVDFVPDVLWSEDWSGASANVQPSAYNFTGTNTFGGSSLTYVNSSANTKTYNDALAGGTSPELLLSKSNQTWTITGIPFSDVKDATLTFKSNKTTFAVTSSTSGVTISGSQKKWTISTTSGAGTISLEIKNTGSSNVRIDDICLSVSSML